MTRVAIIDHTKHYLYIEDIPDEDIECWCGDEESYIKDVYGLEDGEFSWDYITCAEYIPENCDIKSPLIINFKNII